MSTAIAQGPSLASSWSTTSGTGNGVADRTQGALNRFSKFTVTSLTLIGTLSGTATSSPQSVDPSLAAASGLTRAGRLVETAQPVALDRAPEVADTSIRDDAAETVWIKEHSGLTWEHLGKVFGVSRRAVHMWANGGRLNDSNARALREFSAVIREAERQVGGSDAARVRAHLLAVGSDGRSIVGQLRDLRTAGGTWAAPFGPERLIDAGKPLGDGSGTDGVIDL